MGLLSRISQLVNRLRRDDRRRQEADDFRRCRFETMEPRRLMDADPIRVGMVYIEQNDGDDSIGDSFELTFLGGAAGTELTQAVLSGDLYEPGLSRSDMIFDTVKGGYGHLEAQPFKVESLQTQNPSATVNATVADGTSLLTLDFTGFQAGDKLIFSIDVDEVVKFNTTTRVGTFDSIASGAEFEDSQLTTYFKAPHYHHVDNAKSPGLFVDDYDPVLASTGLNLSTDDANGLQDRTDGVSVALQQIALPISIAGNVFLDNNLNLVKDSSEAPLSNVELALWKKDGVGYSFTGFTTKTAADGSYEFGANLNQLPGTYQVRETQPAGLFSVGAIPGTVDGQSSGATVSDNRDVLTEISIPLGGQKSIRNDFGEAQPARVSGFVYHDRSNDGQRGNGEEGLTGVTIHVVPISTIVPQQAVTLSTNDLGFYESPELAPGTYKIVEASQPVNYLDGRDTAGTVNGTPTGNASNELLEQIALNGGQSGIEYNFGELVPAKIRGNVDVTDKDGNCNTPGARPIPNVTIRLLDSSGKQIAETKTNDQGDYQFTGLAPGLYRVVEVHPAAFLNGDTEVGTVAGQAVGAAGNDAISGIVLGSGQDGLNYDFCEHDPSTIAGFVYHDANQNGAKDSGEEAIPNAEVTLLDGNGSVVGKQITDALGGYQFVGLSAGSYMIAEKQPTGWLDGRDAAGMIDGKTVGTATNDKVNGVSLRWGEHSVRNDFGELKPGSIAGQVHLDANGDCMLDPNEVVLEGVLIELLDENGNVLRSQRTDTDGRYQFSDLVPGVYSVRERQPTGVFHGGQSVGSGSGDNSVIDLLGGIQVDSGQNLVDYNFCEVAPASLAGNVWSDPNKDCVFNQGDSPLSDVTIELIDDQNQVIATTKTGADGSYKFMNLAPGSYSVREVQPIDFFQGGHMAGSKGGDVLIDDLIAFIDVLGGDTVIDNDFCETPSARIAGVVFQDGATIQLSGQSLTPQTIGQLRDGKLTSDDLRIPGVVMELRDGFTGDPIDASEALSGQYPAGNIRVTTDVDGHYEFNGIPGGRSYAVFQIHPDGYIDSIDTVGTTTGFAFNSQLQSQSFVLPLAGQPADDAIIRIAVAPGQSSEDNNFSEIKVESNSVPPITPPPAVPFPPPQTYLTPPIQQAIPLPTRVDLPVSYVSWITRPTIVSETVAGSIGYSWHLSVINGGMPRDLASATKTDDVAWKTATHLDQTNWVADHMSEARWVLGANARTGRPTTSRSLVFGVRGAIPFVGDFNGDGTSEIGVFYRGEWFVDLNGNGVWDESDLWAKLGDELDRPVVGDWDGDGKDDIGIHGPEWLGDHRQMDREPGLPDSQNTPVAQTNDVPKNVPPTIAEATDGQRLLRLNAQGPRRADVIDHVFRFGSEGDVPVAGDWNGDGIRTIGVFAGGEWRVDTDGDGLLGPHEKAIRFGSPGDVPLVGDWDGNGVEEIGIFRSGKWILDVNGNRELDAHDKLFELGGAADHPVVGDWDGDGVDEPGIYRELPAK